MGRGGGRLGGGTGGGGGSSEQFNESHRKRKGSGTAKRGTQRDRRERVVGRERESVPPCRRRGRKTAGKRTPESLRKLRPAAAPIGGRRLSQPHVPSFRASSRLAAWLSNWHAGVLSRTVPSRSLVSSLSSSPPRSLSLSLLPLEISLYRCIFLRFSFSLRSLSPSLNSALRDMTR